MKTIVIAEAGVNHNGDINIAYDLIDQAAEAGADIIKFQTFDADRLVTPQAAKASYQKRKSNDQESQYAMLKKLELTRSMHESLMEKCEKANIEFFSSAFDLVSLDYLISLDLPRIKIPSGEITNLYFLEKAGSTQKPIILSSGMSTLEEIANALEVLCSCGTRKKSITVLHCNTEYPVPINEVNLNAINTIKKTLGVEVGFSDHSEGIEVSIAAVALGATVIEKHFTLDRKLPGPDHKVSTEPKDFSLMIKSIRNIEKAMGDGIKRPSLSELDNMKVARKSIVASKPITKGEKFSNKNLTAKRPGTGLSPMIIEEIFGKKAKKDFKVDELIET